MNIGISEGSVVESSHTTVALNKANALIKHISNNQFSETLTSARDKDTLDKLGIMLDPGPWSLRIDEPLSTHASREGLNLLGQHSRVDFGRELDTPGKPTLELGEYYMVKGGEPPIDFLQGVAEIYVEEWLHIVQELRIKDGLDLSLSGLSQEPEIDVAIYLVKKGYKPSDYFLARSGRREKLHELGLI